MNPADSEANFSLQLGSQLKEPLISKTQGQDQASEELSFDKSYGKSIENKIESNDNVPKERIIKGNGLRLFPIFRDFGLSTFSINYALYFEFSDIIIRILFQLFILELFLRRFDALARVLIFPIYFETDDQIRARCQSQESCILYTKSLIECKQTLIAAFCCVATSLFAMMFQTYIRKKEEKRIINNPMLYDFNWTQDFFSVLIENIPKGATESELKTFFNNLKSVKQIQGEVKEIVFIQDISSCTHILQEINSLKEKNSQQPDNKKTIQDLKDELFLKQSKLPLHDGKAIVVFDSLRTRSVILQLFRHSRANFLEALLRGYDTHLAFKDSYLTAQSLPEPQNLNFENLCYPKSTKDNREILAFALNIGMAILATVAIFIFKFIPAEKEVIANRTIFWNEKIKSMIQDTMSAAALSSSSPLMVLESYSFPIILLVIQTLQDKAFEAIEKLTKRTSKTDSEEKCLNYSIYSSFFLYLFMQGLLMGLQWEDAGDIAQKTIKVYCLKHLVNKLGALFFCYRKANYPEFNNRKGCYYSIRDYVALKVFKVDMPAKDFQFKFFKNASKIFPLVAMNFAFLANGSTIQTIPTTILITIITLYIGVICDKYCLINQPEQSSSSSARFMLKLFRFFKADHFAFLFGALIWLFACYVAIVDFSKFLSQYSPQKTEFSIIFAESTEYIQLIIIAIMALIIGIYLFYLAVWPASESLESKFDFYFEQHRSLVCYDVVSQHFTQSYKNPLTSYLASSNEKTDLIL